MLVLITFGRNSVFKLPLRPRTSALRDVELNVAVGDLIDFVLLLDELRRRKNENPLLGGSTFVGGSLKK